jgi:DNA-binding NtrC family response regulator
VNATTQRSALVVDDDRGMVRTLTDILALKGWEVTTASSGEEAIEKAAIARFTAVLMDVRMAGMSGVDTLRELKRRRPTMPVVLMTAYSDPTTLSNAWSAGATRVLPKPLSIPELLRLLERLAETRRDVLLIDDDPAFLRSFSDLLVGRGFHVKAVSSLDDALVELQRGPLLAVLIDVKLHHLDPRTVVKTIRRASPAASLVLFSGYPDLLDDIAAQAREERVIGRLRKPFSVDDLTRMLDGAAATD